MVYPKNGDSESDDFVFVSIYHFMPLDPPDPLFIFMQSFDHKFAVLHGTCNRPSFLLQKSHVGVVILFINSAYDRILRSFSVFNNFFFFIIFLVQSFFYLRLFVFRSICVTKIVQSFSNLPCIPLENVFLQCFDCHLQSHSKYHH